jgi:MFS transporter, SP family, general alpha glucoside:H+ symporter
VAFASQWAFAGFAVSVGLLIPESLNHLLSKGKVEQAHNSFARLHRTERVEAGIQTLALTLEQEISLRQIVQKTSLMDCFKGPSWRRTSIIFYVNTLQQWLSVTLLANSSDLLELGGMSAANSLMVLEVGVGIGLPAKVISRLAMTILGRRFILLVSTIFVGILRASIGVASCFPRASAPLW